MEKRSPHRCPDRGWTLIELLAGLAIVAILSILIQGAVRNGMSGAKDAKSLSQLRNVAAAMNLYCSEHDEYFPSGYYYKGTIETTYVTEIQPYLDIKLDPNRPAASPVVSPNATPVKPSSSFVRFTYSVHGLLCADTSSSDARIKRNRITRPTEVILLGDGCQSPTTTCASATFRFPTEFRNGGSNAELSQPVPVGPDADTSAGMGWLRYRNRGRAAVAMVDGHCELKARGTITYGNIIADR